MHSAWWAFAIGTLLVVIWGFWMAFARRGEPSGRELVKRETAEGELRHRFAQGEISEERLTEMLRILRESK
jgi:uncharacterized membrane protein